MLSIVPCRQLRKRINVSVMHVQIRQSQNVLKPIRTCNFPDLIAVTSEDEDVLLGKLRNEIPVWCVGLYEVVLGELRKGEPLPEEADVVRFGGVPAIGEENERDFEILKHFQSFRGVW